MPRDPEPRSRRAVLRFALGGLAAVGAGSALTLNHVLSRRIPSAEASTGSPPVSSPPRQWLSGAAGPTAADGSFGRWRGADVAIIGTWADNNDAMVQLWQLQPGEELAAWTGPLDIAVGAIGPGESWGEAASGAYDERWRACLTALGEIRGSAIGSTYIRFAHELNGDWYPWQVDAGSAESFVRSWGRFRALQRDLVPEARLVFCVNRETVGGDLDWRRAFPGPDQTDLFAVDYYNQYPFVETISQWAATLEESDEQGAPKGLERHRAFAAEAGLPFAVSEWSVNADMGDSPVFVEQMHAYFGEHGGSGPGQLAYEIAFNINRDDNRWSFHPVTRMPASAEAYRSLW